MSLHASWQKYVVFTWGHTYILPGRMILFVITVSEYVLWWAIEGLRHPRSCRRHRPCGGHSRWSRSSLSWRGSCAWFPSAALGMSCNIFSWTSCWSGPILRRTSSSPCVNQFHSPCLFNCNSSLIHFSRTLYVVSRLWVHLNLNPTNLLTAMGCILDL